MKALSVGWYAAIRSRQAWVSSLEDVRWHLNRRDASARLSSVKFVGEYRAGAIPVRNNRAALVIPATNARRVGIGRPHDGNSLRQTGQRRDRFLASVGTNVRFGLRIQP